MFNISCHKTILLNKLCLLSVSSREEVLSMQEFANSKGMEVIPLVQTFGHMEVRQTPFLSYCAACGQHARSFLLNIT